MRLFIDTNVLIDYYLNREPFRTAARLLFVGRSFGDLELWVSAKSFTDIFYFGCKAVGSKAIQGAMEASLAWINQCSISSADIQTALARRWDDFEDCLIDVAAQKVKADYIVTRDAKGFERSAIPVVSPDQLLGVLEQDLRVTYEEVSW